MSSSGYLSRSFPPSLAPSSLAPLTHPIAPSFPAPSLLRLRPPSPLSLSRSHTVHSSLVPFINPHSRSLPPSYHRFLPPSPCSLLPPTLPLLPPTHLPSFLAPSLPPSLPACLPAINSMYTVCVCVWQAALSRYGVGHSHACHWDNGVFAPVAGVVSVARCYLQRLCSHHESVFDEE